MVSKMSVRELQAFGRQQNTWKLRKNNNQGINFSFFSTYKGKRVFIKHCFNSYTMELAYYKVSIYFGFKIVPNTIVVKSTYQSYEGHFVLQEYVDYNDLSELKYEKYESIISDLCWSEELSQLLFMDLLFIMTDRHDKNLKVKINKGVLQIKAIDNGHAFSMLSGDPWDKRIFENLNLEGILGSGSFALHKKVRKKIKRWIENFGSPFSSDWNKNFDEWRKIYIPLDKHFRYGNVAGIKRSKRNIKRLYKSDFILTEQIWG